MIVVKMTVDKMVQVTLILTKIRRTVTSTTSRIVVRARMVKPAAATATVVGKLSASGNTNSQKPCFLAETNP